MSQRRLALHASALSDAEYAVYTGSLKDLVLGDSDAHEGGGEDDEYFARMQMGVREARAWLRGRYADVPVQTIDTILRFFSPSLAPGDTMSGTEFFAALRLVVHASNGTMSAQEVDRGMAFVQGVSHPSFSFPVFISFTHKHFSFPDPTQPAARAQPSGSRPTSTPSSRAQSPSKRYNPFAPAQPQGHGQSSLPSRDPPPPQHPQHPSLAHSSYSSYKRESHRGESAHGSSASRPRSQGQGSGHSQSQSHGHNPFTTVHTVAIASSSAGPPQIPPRKPPSESSTAAHPASVSTLPSAEIASKRKSAPPVPPPRPSRRDGDRDRSMSPTKAPGMSRSNSVLQTAPPPPPQPPLPSSFMPSTSSFPHAQTVPLVPAAPHITTPLMRQSLHASQIGQSLQKAEARMEKERVMQVLRTSAGAGSTSGSAETSEERGRAPPLPQRRPSGRIAPPPPAQGTKPSTSSVTREGKGRQQLPSPPSSMGSIASIENVALAGDLAKRERERLSSRSPTKPPPPPPPPPPPHRRRETVSNVSSGASYAQNEYPEASGSGTAVGTPSRPPPTHPDRAKRNLESFEAVYGPTLVFPSTPSEHGHDQAGMPSSPFSPVSPSPPSGSPSPSPLSRYGRDTMGSGSGPATPPGVAPRVFRSKSMHYKPPLPPPYGTAATVGDAASASASPFASSSAAQSRIAQASPAPPPPPARRKRPESFQVLPSSSHSASYASLTNNSNSGLGGPFGLVSPTTGTMNAYGVVAAAGYGSTKDIPERGGLGYVPPAKPFNAFGSTSKTPVRRTSLSVSTTPAGVGAHRERDGDGERSDTVDRDRDSDVFAALAKDSTAPSSKDRPNPIAGLKSTFASANAALMPTLERAREGLDKARYKAEAGLSRRGYMRHNVGYGYASGGRGERDDGSGGSSDDEAPLSDPRGGKGNSDEEEIRGGMRGLSISRERERDRARERQEMAGLVGGVDGRMKAPSARMKTTKKGRSRDVDRDSAAAPSGRSARGHGYGLERDWDEDEDRPSVDAGPDVDSDSDDDRENPGRARGLGTEKDNLKWPAGEGWKPL
ncbi:hypothetical protein D9619_013526 [Psilocybe cf. subviscida]|uniref:Uncharacterized protein n=1 Tax=Psilocybe cf. subviscida TaxID=2480587 RepID=A0A8H5F4E0_9AGAR|nr:hypothetical protein D9619_013526 [Psilocybe cf. subviscida]